jgi:hypothetical protein
MGRAEVEEHLERCICWLPTGDYLLTGSHLFHRGRIHPTELPESQGPRPAKKGDGNAD